MKSLRMRKRKIVERLEHAFKKKYAQLCFLLLVSGLFSMR